MDQGLLILVAVPSLEEKLIDLLLEQVALSGFTTSNISAHDVKSKKLNLLEQVTGRQQKVQFMVYADLIELQHLIDILKLKFINTDLRYILLSAIASEVI